MKLSDYLSDFISSGFMVKRATLNQDMELNNGESMKKGEEVLIMKDYGDGTYHAEMNDFATKVHKSEITFL